MKELLTEGRPEFQECAPEGNEEIHSLEVKLDDVVKAIKTLKNVKAP